MRKQVVGAVWAGLSLIGLGVAILVANTIGWDKIWPLLPLLGGLALFGAYFSTGMKDGGLVFAGTAGVLVGLFFFGFTLYYLEWGDMSKLWPVFPLIGGVAFFLAFLAERRTRDFGLLGLGLATIAVGVGGLAFTYGYVGSNILNFWPLLIVLVGVISLIGALTRIGRKP